MLFLSFVLYYPHLALPHFSGQFRDKQKKKRSVKKTKDSGATGGDQEPQQQPPQDRKSDDGAEVPAVDDGDNVAPTIVEGQLKPEIREAMKSPSPPPKDIITRRQPSTSPPPPAATKPGNPDNGLGDTSMAEHTDKRRAKEASPSAAALLAHEILSPVMNTLPPETDEPYVPPTAVLAGDMNALQELDERKIIELREAFNLFDLDHDGCIDSADLKATFQTLNLEVGDDFVASMLADAMDPLNFESFVLMYGIKTIEMDPEVVLLEALSKWDKERTGQISIER